MISHVQDLNGNNSTFLTYKSLHNFVTKGMLYIGTTHDTNLQ